MYHTLVLGHSICTQMRDYWHSGHNTHLCPDFKLSTTTSVEICGQGGLTMTRLMANGGTLFNSIMGRVSNEPDIIFLQVGGNDFPRTARNQRDADAFFLAAFGVSLTAQQLVQGKEGCCGLRFAVLFSSQITERFFSSRS